MQERSIDYDSVKFVKTGSTAQNTKGDIVGIPDNSIVAKGTGQNADRAYVYWFPIGTLVRAGILAAEFSESGESAVVDKGFDYQGSKFTNKPVEDGKYGAWREVSPRPDRPREIRDRESSQGSVNLEGRSLIKRILRRK